MIVNRLRGVGWMVGKSLRQHALATIVTVFSVALGCGLLMAVFAIKKQTYDAFTGGNAGFDAVLGARGSQLQLVLNTVFHLETSPGNLPWSMYAAIKKDPRVELAVPYAVGDNFRGFRIVGTTDEMFTRFEYLQGRISASGAPSAGVPAAGRISASGAPSAGVSDAGRISASGAPSAGVSDAGRIFDSKRLEAVIGSVVSEKTGLVVGSKFNPYHGLVDDENMHHSELYDVVGVLRPTNSPADRVIWIPIDGLFHLGGHVLRGSGEMFVPVEGEDIPDEHKEVSAVMLKLRSPMAGFSLDQMINRQGKTATLAWPIARVMAELFEKIGWMNRVLELVAYLVVVVAGASILAGVYNTINGRRREFAILRAMGASRRRVFSVIVLESAVIAGLGSILGYAVYSVILIAVATIIRTQVGVVLDVFQFHPVLVLTPPGMCVIGAFAGIIPAIKAYATDVAEHLAPIS